MISNIANLVYELTHEIQNHLRLKILGIYKILEKYQIWVETKPRVTQKKKIKLFISCPILLDFSILLQIFVRDCSNITNDINISSDDSDREDAVYSDEKIPMNRYKKLLLIEIKVDLFILHLILKSLLCRQN